MNLRFNLLFCFLLVCLVSSAGTRRALVVGIGAYGSEQWPAIHGDRDVKCVAGMLSSLGYTDIDTLVGSHATKAGIVDAFSRMRSRCKEGDIVYIHFSGHGQQITDLDGDEHLNQPKDRYDEAWIPYDAKAVYDKNGYRGENHLVDDEIGVWMQQIRRSLGEKGALLLVVDACHSGDSHRGFEDDSDEDYVMRGSDKPFEIPLKQMPLHVNRVKDDWITLSACNSSQVNCEIKTADGSYYGSLTYAIFCNFRRFAHMDNDAIRKVIENFIYDSMCNPYRQTPTLGGNSDKYDLRIFF